MNRSTTLIDSLWYGFHPLRWVLYPFACMFQIFSAIRRIYLTSFKQKKFPVPVIVIGNLTVGGVGKTPLVIALAQVLKDKGLRVGIVTRGYGCTLRNYPYVVSVNDKSTLVGDEPLLLARRTGCPVVIAPKRVNAVQYLLDNFQSQVILSDDGLQHYAMGRSLEIVVVDGMRGLGNGLCLPAGPLREPPRRLRHADFVVVNGGEWPAAHHMDLKPGDITQMSTGKSICHSELTYPVAAISAIGNPHRFYATLGKLGIHFNAHTFNDHHQFKQSDLIVDEATILMTEKDAVKCYQFTTDKMFFLPVHAQLSNTFWDALWAHQAITGLC